MSPLFRSCSTVRCMYEWDKSVCGLNLVVIDGLTVVKAYETMKTCQVVHVEIICEPILI